MTIYTPNKAEKKDGALLKAPQVVKSDSADGNYVKLRPSAAQIRFERQARRKKISVWLACCIGISAIMLTVSCIYAIIHLYKTLAIRRHESYRFFCRVEAPGERALPFSEDVEFDADIAKYEKIRIPSLNEFEEATVLHDFETSWTAIIDPVQNRCFISPLNKTVVAPPKDFFDLIKKLRSGYYLPNTNVLQEHYVVRRAPINNFRPYGYYIYMECNDKMTYLLEPANETFTVMTKRSVGETFHTHYSAGHVINDVHIRFL
jgi:integral membrane protein 2C